MELPPHYHQIKADEARHFAQSLASRSLVDHYLDLRAKLKRAEQELTQIREAWTEGVGKWRENHESIPTAFAKLARVMDSLANDQEHLQREEKA